MKAWDRSTHLQQGRQAEDRALAHLVAAGLRVVARNFRAARGEIDLVMRDGATLVFVEVRFRKSAAFGGASESVTWRKRARIQAAATEYLSRYPAEATRPCRFDVVAITDSRLEWLRAAFEA